MSNMPQNFHPVFRQFQLLCFQYSQERSVMSSLATSQDDGEGVAAEISEDSLVFDPETCLALNRAYQELVGEYLQKIETMLVDIQTRQVGMFNPNMRPSYF
jgi:hypothetical protein